MDSDWKKDSLDRKGKERELKELPDRQQKGKTRKALDVSPLLFTTRSRPVRATRKKNNVRSGARTTTMSRFAGRTIGEIHVYRNNVFEGSKPVR
ncbi:MAG: hypothetical protein ACLR8Y_20715 [Alistipes indistinctus]